MDPLGPISREFVIINRIEAGFWGAVACICLYRAIRSCGRERKIGLIAVLTLLAFGGSDLVEAHTGAWWHPWWLLIWKGVCLAIFATILVSHLIQKRRDRKTAQPSDAPTE